MEMMTLSDTCVVRITGVTPERFKARRMSRWKPMEGIRNSWPLKSRTSNRSRPPRSYSGGRMASSGSSARGSQSTVIPSWRLAKPMSALSSRTQRYTSSTLPIWISTVSSGWIRRNCWITSGSQCMAMLE